MKNKNFNFDFDLLLTAHHADCGIETALGQHHLLLPDDLPVPREVNLHFVSDLHLGPPPVLLVSAVGLVLLCLLLRLVWSAPAGLSSLSLYL